MGLLCFCAALLSLSAQAQGKDSIPSRVAALLPQMTTEEKVYQLLSFLNGNTPETYGLQTDQGVGRLQGYGNDPEEIIARRNSLQAEVLNGSRLNIPASFHSEALHGCCPGGTVFPMPVNQGAPSPPPCPCPTQSLERLRRCTMHACLLPVEAEKLVHKI